MPGSGSSHAEFTAVTVKRARTSAAWPVAIAVVLLTPTSFGQRQSFKYYGQERGLSNLATECLLQDRAGYLWVGTQNGLFRYDGSTFTPFTETEGLPSAAIDALAETADGVLWVATSRGLAFHHSGRFEAADRAKSIESSGRFGLAADKGGRLYLTTLRGLQVSNAPSRDGGRRFEPLPGHPSGPAYGVHVDEHGVVWFGCGSAVCRVSTGGVTSFGVMAGVPSDRWDAIVTDREGAVWIRSSRHLLRKAVSRENFEPLPVNIPKHGDFASLSLGRDGTLFVPTDEGMWEFGRGRWHPVGQQQGLMAGSISSVLQDREGSIWIGLWGSGLARWIGRNHWEGWTRADGLSGEHVWNITRDLQGSLWVATETGLSQLYAGPRKGRRFGRTWTERDGLFSSKTRAMTLAPDGAVWTGASPGGLTRIDPVSGVVQRYLLPPGPGNDRIWHLGFDRAGTLWVSARGGLFFSKSDRGVISFDKQPLPLADATETISHTFEDREGRLWVAGERGLACRENGAWRRYTKKDGLPSDAAGFLAQSPDGSIWLGYRDRTGLSRLRVENGRVIVVESYTHRSGLMSDQAIFVSVDSRGWVWFGTDRGVDVLIDGKWRHYGQQDGLIWDDCDTDAFYEDADGSVWIGTSRGLAHFRGEVSQVPVGGPRVEFTRFQLGDQTIDPVSGRVEPYRNRAVSASIAVLTFLAEDNVLCRYRLIGLDEGWLETSLREVRFSNLPAGKFVLEAMARNASGEWSATPARIAFEILPPWWATWWFRSAALLLTGCGLFQLIHWRTHRLVRARVRLEAAVEDRTAQLRIEQRRIEQQNSEIEGLLEQARQASTCKDQFLANMSHEIRTPINGIFGMINLTLATELNPEQKEALETVNSCTQSLLSVLNDILDLSKIEAGKLEITPVVFRTEATVHAACSTFAATALNKGIGLTWVVDGSVPEWLEADSMRIQQVLLNLIGNALKFTHQGTVRVSASAQDFEDGSVRLSFEVSDTGIGISENLRSIIFEPFRQADGSTARVYGGTGLGLTISSRLVRLMGGTISVESELGSGSVFGFSVKARRATAPVGLARGPVPVFPAKAARPLRLLLAEDNVVNQRVATAVLERCGHTVEVVENGRLAVQRTAIEVFDMILMDLQMPEVDGWAATRQIRERDRDRGVYVPIIALTAHAMSEARERCLAAGMDAVVVKPFDPAQLCSTIEQLGSKRLADAPAVLIQG